MNKIIKIYDNLLPKTLEDRIEEFTLYSRHYIYAYANNVAGPNQKENLPGMSHSFLRDNQISEYNGFLSQPLYIFSYLKNINIHKVINSRVFITFPLKNSDNFNYIHNDQHFPHFVCLYYINDSDGDTIFYNDQEEEIKRVSPKKGRILFFDGTIKHSGSYPTKLTRGIINYNFSGEFFGEEEKN